jgi:FkbM family methyltransferase
MASRKVKKALSARHLFDNWHSLVVGYVLAKLGLKNVLKVKIKGYVFEMSPDVFEWLLLWYSHRLAKYIDCVDGTLILDSMRIKLTSGVVCDAKAFAEALGWTYDASRDCWIKNGVAFKRMYMSVIEVFDLGYYDVLNVRDKVVIDVGSFVGDSAIYFALKGARKVIAIEPHVEAFQEMLENIKLNGLEGIVVPVNAGLASKPGKVHVKGVDVVHTQGTYHKLNKCGEIPAVTLSELINKYDLNDGVLKMDCEGCEYDIVLNDYEHVKAFDELIVDYHVGDVPKLLEVLSKDYWCKILRGDEYVGTIHCTKR